MKEKRHLKINFGTAILMFIIIVLIIIIVSFALYTNKIKNNIAESNSKETSNISQSESTNTENNENIITDTKLNFEDEMVNYIIDSIKIYAQNGTILKDTTGDVTASKLTTQEFESNEKNYKKEIKDMLEDKSIFSDKFIRNNKECCTYNLEKILNKFGFGTHMGIGIGCYDSNNKKIYEKGKTEIEEYEPTNSNVIKYFGYEKNDLINNILDEIEKCVNNNYILKSTTGDVTAPKLTLTEMLNNRTEYQKTIDGLIDDIGIFSEIYFENNKLIVKCHFEDVLNKLGIGTHMGIGTDVDDDGVQIFIVE